MASKKHAEPAHDRAQLTAEHERLRVEQAQTKNLDTDEARARFARIAEIEAELATPDDDNGDKHAKHGKHDDDDAA